MTQPTRVNAPPLPRIGNTEDIRAYLNRLVQALEQNIAYLLANT